MRLHDEDNLQKKELAGAYRNFRWIESTTVMVGAQQAARHGNGAER